MDELNIEQSLFYVEFMGHNDDSEQKDIRLAKVTIHERSAILNAAYDAEDH